MYAGVQGGGEPAAQRGPEHHPVAPRRREDVRALGKGEGGQGVGRGRRMGSENHSFDRKLPRADRSNIYNFPEKSEFWGCSTRTGTGGGAELPRQSTPTIQHWVGCHVIQSPGFAFKTGVGVCASATGKKYTKHG